MLLDGTSLKEIVYKVDVSYKTAERDRTSLYRKLGVQSFQELVAKYGSHKNGSVVQNKNYSKNVFLNKYRIIFIIFVIVLILAASFFFSWFFTRKASVDAQLPDLSIFNPLRLKKDLLLLLLLIMNLIPGIINLPYPCLWIK